MAAIQKKKIVSVRQIEVLVEFLENHRDLAIGRLRSKEARALSQRLWADCANLLNSEADGVSRSPKEWQKWYTDYKSRILSRQRQIRENIGGTGGGAGVPVIPLGGLEERLCSLLAGDTPVVGRDGTLPEQVRINPIHENEEISPGFEHVELVVEEDNIYENIEIEDIEPIFSPPLNRISPPPIDIDSLDQRPTQSRQPRLREEEVPQDSSLHQRPRQSRRGTRRLREEEVPHSSLEDSRQMLVNLEALRCESTRLLAESIKQLAAALIQNAEATKDLAQSTRLANNKRCCCRRRSE